VHTSIGYHTMSITREHKKNSKYRVRVSFELLGSKSLILRVWNYFIPIQRDFSFIISESHLDLKTFLSGILWKSRWLL